LNVPSIGGAKGIFEILVPGIFLFINLVIPYYVILQNDITELIDKLSNSEIIVTIIMISFGYLLGVILRILRVELADKVVKKIHNYQNDFPYTDWLYKVIKKNYPEEVLKFYDVFWHKKTERSFFNFYKTMITSEDERAAIEVYTAEALTRYIASMFYALIISILSIIIAIIYQIMSFGFTKSSIMTITIITLWLYFIAILLILKNFRYVRVKEVETVFAATFKNRHLFEKLEDKHMILL